MTDAVASEPKAWRRFVRRLLSFTQYFTGQEASVEDTNEAVFRAAFPDVANPANEKRVLGRHRICIPAVLAYGVAGNTEKTEVTNLNERGLLVFGDTTLPPGSL